MGTIAGVGGLALRRTWVQPAIWVGLAALYGLIRLVELGSVTPERTGDTPFFLEMVGATPLAMLSGFKPFATPLLWTLVGGNPDGIVRLHVLFAAVSWACLGVLVVRAVQVTWLKYCAFVGITAIGLAWDVANWNHYLLGESSALSLLALTIACWLWLLEEWQPLRLASLLLVIFLWANTRDSNAYLLLMLAAVTATVALVWRKHRKYGLVTIALGCIVLTAMASSIAGNRWVFPYLNVVGKRILTDPEKTAYFAGAGMPVTPAVMNMSGKWASDDDGAFYFDPDLQGFRDWVNAKGKQTYVSYLASHPVQTVTEPLADMPSLISLSPLDRPLALFLVIAAPFCLLLALFRRPWKHHPFLRAWLVPVVLILLAYPHAVVIWHGDAMHVDRHLLEASIQLRIGLCLLLIFSIEALVLSGVQDRRLLRERRLTTLSG